MASLRPPLDVQRPERVPRLPDTMAGGCVYQVKLDGHRVLAFRDDDGVTLQARSGRIVTQQFPELIEPLGALPPGTVLDGEAVAVRKGVFDFHALASPAPVRRVGKVAVSYVAFDVLAHEGRDLRSLPLSDRLARLTLLLRDAPTQVQLVMSTGDRAEAEAWMPGLVPLGIEGVVAKSLSSKYRSGTGHGWQKWRVTETDDAELVGHRGPASRPTALRVRLDDGREATTVNLDAVHARQASQALAEAGSQPLLVEVRVAGAGGRHERVEFVRVRPPE